MHRARRGTGSAATARRWVAAGVPFDAVVLAGRGSGRDGQALVAALRHVGARGPEVPLVLLTPLGRHLGRDADDDRPPGPLTVVTTPVRPAPFFRALAGVPAGPGALAGPPGGVPAPAPLRLLVAEDHPVNQRLILLMLARLGHRADLVSNGAEAVTAVRRRAYDAVLMDVGMPGMDGPTATRLIRRQLGDRRPWIIAVTANALPGDRAAVLEAGMDDYLTKPLAAAELAAALTRAAAGAAVGAAVGAAAGSQAAPVVAGPDGHAAGAPDLAAPDPARPDPAARELPARDLPVRDLPVRDLPVRDLSALGVAALDPAALDDLRGLVGDAAVLSGLIADFLAETPPLVGDLRAAVAGGDHERAHRTAHTLAGLGATFGATTMARLCRRAQDHAGPAADMGPVVDEIAAEHERVARALRLLG